MNDLHVLDLCTQLTFTFTFTHTYTQRETRVLTVMKAYWREVEECYRRINFLCGNNLTELSVSQLEELEGIYLNGLKTLLAVKVREELAEESGRGRNGE